MFAALRMTAAGFLMLAGLIGLGACGGGGGGGASAGTPSQPPPTGGGPTWTAGVYPAASTFKNRCEVVRTGVDIEGNGFPDVQGTGVDERFWLRSWTNETYLWNTEVEDRNPASFSTRRDYFAVLRTTARTSSGKDKDDFHFSEATTDYVARRNAAPRATYGAVITALSSTPPRDFRVRYTEPAAPASTVLAGQPNLVRGSRILRLNGIDLVNANTQSEIDALNAALSPSAAGVATVFQVQDPGASAPRTVTLTSVSLSPTAVNRTAVIDGGGGSKVGYVLFNTFSPFASEQQIYQAILDMRTQGVSDLVLDLRYNGGGLLAVASQLSYMVAGPARTTGRDFERLRFNAAAGNRNPVTGQTNSPVPFYTTGLGFTLNNSVSLPSLNLGRVFVLSTGSTCSASEAVINGLRGIGVEVVLIGDKTCGKPFGFYPQDNCGETYYTIQFQTVNHVGFGDYADGFIPDNSTASFGVRLPGCQVSDDPTRELGDPAERMLQAALGFRASRACPSPPSAGTLGVPDAASVSRTPGISLELPAPGVMDDNRDMTMPPGR